MLDDKKTSNLQSEKEKYLKIIGIVNYLNKNYKMRKMWNNIWTRIKIKLLKAWKIKIKKVTFFSVNRSMNLRMNKVYKTFLKYIPVL